MYNEMIRSTLPNFPARISPNRHSTSKGSIVPIHFHEEVESLYCKKGSMRVNFLNTSAIITAGDVLFINERTPHETVTASEQNCVSCVQFDCRPFLAENASCKNMHAMAFLNESFHSFVLLRSTEPLAQELMHYFDRMAEEYVQKTDAWQEYIKGYILLTIAALSRNNLLFTARSSHNAAALLRLEPVFTYIDAHYAAPITLEDMAEAIRLHPSYLCRLFRQATGSTLSQYLNFVRVYEAEKLLINSKISMTDICSRVGFSDPVYFDRVFRRYNGCTPTAYRKFKYATL